MHTFFPVRLSTTAAIVLVIDVGKGRMRVGEQGVEQVNRPYLRMAARHSGSVPCEVLTS